MEEVTPPANDNTITLPVPEETETDDWQVSLELFTAYKRGKNKEDKKLSRGIKRYYKSQDSVITTLEDVMAQNVATTDAIDEQEKKTKAKASKLSKASFFCNLLLLGGKTTAAVMTGSLSVISSVVDSAVDLISGAILWWTGHAIRKRNIYKYPQGRTKLEPIAIVVLSVIMAFASAQVMREAVVKIIDYAAQKGEEGPTFNIPSTILCILTIAIKLVLFLLCRGVQDPSVLALAQDHRNDIFSNSVALACGFIGDKVWSFADPIGALLISIYIIGSWVITGWQQIKNLSGYTANPEFLTKITWLALNHHRNIRFIDTVRAFHFGSNYLVELHIVLPEDMPLKESHDIGESLQKRLEGLANVERAFVHLDYEFEHSPKSEHKQV